MAAPVRVVVLNWNSAWLTARCVRSLVRTEHPAGELDIVVVDNGSIDGSLVRLRRDLADLPSVRFLDNGANLGFAEGCNRALRDREGVRAIALINNDAAVDPGWLTPLLAELEANPEVGAVGSRLMLELPFVTLELDPGDGRSRARIAAVRVDGIDVTRRCIVEGAEERTDPARPPEVVRRVDRGCLVHVPVGEDRSRTPRIEVDLAEVDEPLVVSLAGTAVDVPASGSTTVALAGAGPRHHRVNGLGTEWVHTTEAADRWFGADAGEADDPRWDDLVPHDTDGFSGGAVLLRPELLDAVGVFDPTFFAYYEDTDLSRRARRAGWRIRCVPASVVHHLHGGSGGTAATGFHFLNYRNWLLAVTRSGSPRDVVAAWRWFAHYAKPAFRPTRRGGAGRAGGHARALWARALLGALAALPGILSARLPGRRRVGVEPTTRVRSRLLPRGVPSAPKRWPGGPTTVYLDVTVTLRSGWRAGIQRVVCKLVEHLPVVAPDLRFVLITWSELHGQFRRVSTAEYAALLAPTTDEQPHRHPPPQHPARKKVGDIARAMGLQPLALWWRRQRALRAEPVEHRDLLLGDLEPGSVLFDLDAVWNRVTPPRRQFAPEQAARGVRGASFVQDIFAVTNPEWFVPTLVSDFTDFLRARVVTDRVVMCSTEDVAQSIRRWAKEEGLPVPRTPVVGLGADSIAPTEDDDAGGSMQVPGGPFVLVVGTVEPRKNHVVVLDAMERLWADGVDVPLVVVGRRGWKADDVADRMEATDPSRLTWWDSVTDAQLDHLYRSATVVVVASRAEGYGLPVVEALQRGAVVLSSAGGALAEVGGEHVETFGPDDPAELAALVARHLTDPDHHQARRDVAATFRPQTWEECARRVAEVLRDVASGDDRGI